MGVISTPLPEKMNEFTGKMVPFPQEMVPDPARARFPDLAAAVNSHLHLSSTPTAKNLSNGTLATWESDLVVPEYPR